jgi:putative redox protein
MMEHIEVLYASGDRFLAHVRDHDIVVDQPRDAGGDDVGPTPTELFVTGLATCVGFFAERFLRRHRLPVEGLRVDCRFSIGEDHPARVGSIDLNVTTPVELNPSKRAALQAVVEHCTVHNSLTRPPSVRIELFARSRAA